MIAAHAFRALRPTQWTKNAVVLAAFIFALGDQQQELATGALWTAIEAALLFCLASSGIYLINDVRDVHLDRAHPKKKLRPIASGDISIALALGMSAVLLGLSLAGSWCLSRDFFHVVAGYVLLQIAYTFVLKKVALVDIFVIAGGFVLRALAGAVAIHVDISPWLLICTLFLALFLGLCKRRHEKVIMADTRQDTRPALDSYDARLLDQLIAVVSAATIVSYSLYTLWPDTVDKFGSARLGFTIPFVIFGLFRYLDLVYRHEKGGRPEQILLTDVPLLIDLALYGGTVLAILLLG